MRTLPVKVLANIGSFTCIQYVYFLLTVVLDIEVLNIIMLILAKLLLRDARTLLPDTNNNNVFDIVASVLHGACLP